MSVGKMRKRFSVLFSKIVSSDELLAEAAKILISALIGSLAILGYSYANGFYSMFGVALNVLELDVFDFLFRGLFFFISFWTAVWIFLIMTIFTSMILLGRRVRNFVIEIALYVVAFSVLASMSISLGQRIASIQGEAIASGSGRVAQCALVVDQSNSKVSQGMKKLIESLSVANRLRFIARDDSYHYFAVVATSQKGGIKSYAIPNSSISFCSIYSRFPEFFRGFGSK